MATLVLKNCGIYLGRFNLSGDMNQISLNASRDVLDQTCFGNASKNKAMGLKDVKITGAGFSDFSDDDNDEFLNGQLSAVQTLMSILPQSSSAGDVAYFLQTHLAEYAHGAKVGDLYAFNISAEGHDELVNGSILVNGAKTATGSGTAYELGAVQATEYLYGGLHVLAVSGSDTPTITVKIQSDDAENFASPTDKITFTDATAVGSQWATPVAGAIADTWWRVNYTITGTNPSFTILVVMGIQ